MERRWWVGLFLAIGLFVAPAAASATTYAPVNRAGPKLSVPAAKLAFWPATRAMVDDLVGLSPSNHGPLDAIPLCKIGCAASIWQRSNAKFIAALNSRTETFAGVSYTDVYTLTDEVVVPNFGPAASRASSAWTR